MALYSINSPNATSAKGFSDIWNHYTKAGFLYEAKLERMKSFLERTKSSVDALIQAPSDFFQLHIAEEEAEIVSSLSGFRDTHSTFVIEHAVSDGRPDLMIQCLLSMTTAISYAGADYVSMFYSPKNRWPSRLARTFSEYYPEGATSTICFDYGIADWQTEPADLTVFDTNGVPTRTHEILSQWISPQRIETMGIDEDADGLIWDIQAGGQLTRTQRVIHAYAGGIHVGCMVLWETPAVMNFSHLCTRAEIYVDKHHPMYKEAAQFLATTAWHLAKQAEREFFVVLTPARAGLSDTLCGFSFPDKQYSCFTWPGNGARGFATSAIALCEWYGRVISRLKGARVSRR